MEITNIVDELNSIEFHQNKVEFYENKIKMNKYHIRRLSNYIADVIKDLSKLPLEQLEVTNIINDRVTRHIAMEEALINSDKFYVKHHEDKIKEIKDEISDFLENYGLYTKD